MINIFVTSLSPAVYTPSRVPTTERQVSAKTCESVGEVPEVRSDGPTNGRQLCLLLLIKPQDHRPVDE